jgi:hypothetical protein
VLILRSKCVRFHRDCYSKVNQDFLNRGKHLYILYRIVSRRHLAIYFHTPLVYLFTSWGHLIYKLSTLAVAGDVGFVPCAPDISGLLCNSWPFIFSVGNLVITVSVKLLRISNGPLQGSLIEIIILLASLYLYRILWLEGSIEVVAFEGFEQVLITEL